MSIVAHPDIVSVLTGADATTSAAGPYVLRPYQEQAIAAFLAARDRGVRRQLIVIPTGAGKTIVLAKVIHHLRVRALTLAHRDELIADLIARRGRS